MGDPNLSCRGVARRRAVPVSRPQGVAIHASRSRAQFFRLMHDFRGVGEGENSGHSFWERRGSVPLSFIHSVAPVTTITAGTQRGWAATTAKPGPVRLNAQVLKDRMAEE